MPVNAWKKKLSLREVITHIILLLTTVIMQVFKCKSVNFCNLRGHCRSAVSRHRILLNGLNFKIIPLRLWKLTLVTSFRSFREYRPSYRRDAKTYILIIIIIWLLTLLSHCETTSLRHANKTFVQQSHASVCGEQNEWDANRGNLSPS